METNCKKHKSTTEGISQGISGWEPLTSEQNYLGRRMLNRPRVAVGVTLFALHFISSQFVTANAVARPRAVDDGTNQDAGMAMPKQTGSPAIPTAIPKKTHPPAAEKWATDDALRGEAGHEAAGYEATEHEAAGHEAAGHEAVQHDVAGEFFNFREIFNERPVLRVAGWILLTAMGVLSMSIRRTAFHSKGR